MLATMRSALSSAHVCLRMMPTCSNTTLGKYLERSFASKTWEHTRLRKKPSGAGDRILTDASEVFEFNAWDHVQWDTDQEEAAQAAVQKNSTVKMSDDQRERFQSDAPKFWNSFYGIHDNGFFKDRHWLLTEFPELAPNEANDKTQPRSIFELGCGVGNTIFPILELSSETQLRVYGCDFSERAIEILRSQRQFDAKRCEVFVMDATEEQWKVPFEENSQDIIVMIFVLSAIEPSKMQRVLENCYRYLKPGGLLLFRDYGRYDLAQLRFKSGKCLEDNFYVRGDGTMVYFFTEQEIRDMFSKTGLKEEQLIVDRRLQVNRGRGLKMYRVWIQTKFRKPL
ncbi:tRNA N(3)-methylcytidine methyltransferase Mettl2 isoform X1 [Drosophila sulfurigaster albostrigata]|uniref:tRNA N(3)-methylcytidine methyltransferase Mettl2 isoform X1 n=1 Tax=Drosophila sulfurigaster albostrigata TaxID=89887 RepID=UPI002D219BC0|nr:tRNA N(3)-methylcytidine methyltransferase Mettl2 isoform X1 [Drosophila sulfurigaster albostrigata]